MFEDKFSNYYPITLYPPFSKNKHKFSQQELYFFANNNMLNSNQLNENLYHTNNGNRRSLDNRLNHAKNNTNKVNFNSTNYNNWNFNFKYTANQQKQRFSGLASSTGTNFFNAPGSKYSQNGYSKKFSFYNNNKPNYNPKSNSQKKKLKIFAKNKENSGLPERIKSVRGNSVDQKDEIGRAHV